MCASSEMLLTFVNSCSILLHKGFERGACRSVTSITYPLVLGNEHSGAGVLVYCCCHGPCLWSPMPTGLHCNNQDLMSRWAVLGDSCPRHGSSSRLQELHPCQQSTDKGPAELAFSPVQTQCTRKGKLLITLRGSI